MMLPPGAISATRTYTFSEKTVAQRTSKPGVSGTVVSFITGDSVNTPQIMTGPTTSGGTVGITTVKRHADPNGLTRGPTTTAIGTDAADRWFSLLLFLLVLSFMSFTIFHIDPENSWIYTLTSVGLPTLLAVGSLITTNNRTRWLIPAWVPGDVAAGIGVRRSPKATEETTKTPRELTNRQREGSARAAGKLQRLLLTPFSTLTRSRGHG